MALTERERLIKEITKCEKKQERPRVVRRYKYYFEKEASNRVPFMCVWSILIVILVASFLQLGYDEDMVERYVRLGLAVAVMVMLWIRVYLPQIKIGRERRQKLKEARRYGAKYPGKIVAYKIVPQIYEKLKNKQKFVAGVAYVLKVEYMEGWNVICVSTPEFMYCPTAVLKSGRCTVYEWEGECYFFDFDLRTKKSDECVQLEKRSY